MNNQNLVEPYARIDYYSVMLYDVSLGSIFRKFDIDYGGADFPFDVSDTMDISIRQVMYRFPYFRLYINLVDHRLTSSEVKNKYEFMTPSEKSSLFTTEFTSVKLEAAGQELNNWRKAGYCVEDICMDPKFWLVDVAKEFKVTRSDFAFDFIDHCSHPEFSKELSRYLAKMQVEDKLRLSTSNKRPSGLVYKVERSPKGCCCYLGAQRSPEFVRVYDKLQEQAEKVYGTYDTNSWDADCEFRGCKSWDRIELQTRREKSAKLLFSEGDSKSKMCSILKHIFDNYMVCDSDHVPEPFISEYFDTSSIENLNFVQFGELEKYTPGSSVTEQVLKFIDKNHTMLHVIFSIFGADGLIKAINEKNIFLYTSDEVLSKHRLRKRNIKVSEAVLAYGISIDDLPGSYVDENGFRLLKPCTYSDSDPYPASKVYEDRLRAICVIGGDVNG